MRYKATAYYDTDLKHIDPHGYTEYFDSDYSIKEKTSFRFKDLHGAFIVSEVTIDLKEGVVFLLISPDVR